MLVAREMHDTHASGTEPPLKAVPAKDELAREGGRGRRADVVHRLSFRRARLAILARLSRKLAAGRKVAR
jgi:hypothetical protein